MTFFAFSKKEALAQGFYAKRNHISANETLYEAFGKNIKWKQGLININWFQFTEFPQIVLRLYKKVDK